MLELLKSGLDLRDEIGMEFVAAIFETGLRRFEGFLRAQFRFDPLARVQILEGVFDGFFDHLLHFLVIHVHKDLSAPVDAWYFHSSLVWLLVMALGSLLFFVKLSALRRSGTDVAARFSRLPEQ